ncbi:MAG: hypothetical protein M3N48_01495 [Verrucomicrobiota bacterium]|nr:hypothetical protein [Verrucomicrobiota bacterium]
MKRLISGIPLFFTATALLAQDASPTPVQLTDAQAAGALAACAGFGIIVPLVSLAIYLFIAIWVTKDANRRQSPNATLVKVLVWIPPTNIIGLIVHLVTRPKTIPGAPGA